MAATERVICAGTALTAGGKGVRLGFERHGAAAAFIMRYDGRAHAELNKRAHIPVKPDWLEGECFDQSGLYLIRSMRGATCEPATGRCIMGPRKGQRSVALQVAEHGGKIYLSENEPLHG